jgi:hypothetical protein
MDSEGFFGFSGSFFGSFFFDNFQFFFHQRNFFQIRFARFENFFVGSFAESGFVHCVSFYHNFEGGEVSSELGNFFGNSDFPPQNCDQNLHNVQIRTPQSCQQKNFQISQSEFEKNFADEKKIENYQKKSFQKSFQKRIKERI